MAMAVTRCDGFRCARPAPRGLYRVISEILTILLVCFAGSSQSFSDEPCEYPDIVGPMLAPLENQAGEFRIALEPPDYGDLRSTQQHLVFSTIWARLLSSSLARQTDGQCSADISRSLYPDLRVFLFAKPPAKAAIDPSSCFSTLKNLLQRTQFSTSEIKQISSQESAARLNRMANPAGAAIDASNILTGALAQVYRIDSVMHALVTIGPETFQSLDPAAFLGWLQHQQGRGRIGLAALRFCGPEIDPSSATATGAERLPPSETIPPGKLTISIKSGGLIIARFLRNVVIVGEGPVVNFSRSTPPAIEKFCNREHALALDPDLSPRVTAIVRIRCLRSVFYGDSWTIFYCDPSDCGSQRQAETAMTTIAIDSDVLALAKGAFTDRPPKGPYMVYVEGKAE